MLMLNVLAMYSSSWIQALASSLGFVLFQDTLLSQCHSLVSSNSSHIHLIICWQAHKPLCGAIFSF